MARPLVCAAVAVSLFVAVSSAHAQVAKKIDIAGLITKADAEAALGETVKEPQPRNGDGDDGYYSRCNFYTEAGDKSIVLRVHQSSAGKIDAKKQFEMLSSGTGKIQSVSGLGDRAGYTTGNMQGTAAMSTLMLYATKGDAFVTVGLGGMTDDAVALDKAKALARKILASL